MEDPERNRAYARNIRGYYRKNADRQCHPRGTKRRQTAEEKPNEYHQNEGEEMQIQEESHEPDTLERLPEEWMETYTEVVRKEEQRKEGERDKQHSTPDTNSGKEDKDNSGNQQTPQQKKEEVRQEKQ